MTEAQLHQQEEPFEVSDESILGWAIAAGKLKEDAKIKDLTDEIRQEYKTENSKAIPATASV